jgi:hypothetical protein
MQINPAGGSVFQAKMIVFFREKARKGRGLKKKSIFFAGELLIP